ncbi:MAG TPA: hypothetical protein VG937_20945 [Polyangiaceae bacterium]|nr:hypothetical protein [Polyangiaceae bacterium]
MKRNAQNSGYVLLLLAAAASASCAGAGDSSFEDETGTLGQDLCSAVTLVSNDADKAAVPGQLVTWTATPTCTGTAQYQFVVRDPAGVYTVKQNWSSTATFAWDTTGLALGDYSIEARIRDSAGADGYYQKSVKSKFSLNASNPCTSVTTTASPPTTTWAGQTVTFTSSAAGCTNPQFEVHHLNPGSATWEVLSPYSTMNSTWVWNTTTALPGEHRFSFWARGQGSQKTKEAAVNPKYVITASSPCTAATLSASPAGHTPVGSPVTLSAGATCGGAPTFRYLMYTPAGVWQVLQEWTTSPTAVWNTRLATPGTYNLKIYARVTGSNKSYEVTKTIAYTLDAATPATALAIRGGWEHFCELLGTGKVGCWGYNANGELGNGVVSTVSTTPVAVSGITQAIALSVGYSHSCAVLLGGTAKCWGSNLHGQLGNNSTTDSNVPVSVSGIISATSIGSGNSHVCASLSDGSVRCWGYNSRGQLGVAASADKTTPVTVPGISTARQVVAGYYHSCALLADGTVRCWGTNQAGELGNNTGVNSSSPVTVSANSMGGTLSGVVSLNASSGNTCAVKSNGQVWCWGGNSAYGTLGDGTTNFALAPVQVQNVTTAVDVAVGNLHACAALSGGTATCWGFNNRGQLGNATNTDSLVAVPVSNLTNVATVGVSYYSSCATKTDGTASCWGHGTNGELGRGSTANSNIPVAVNAIP